ncbi:hypothetical protein FRC07_006708 [Ceratobasidium sp. 392]|nr:hypothetical protein FRC07_006708 [Ceratobasidium sp. 392]
MDAIIRDQVSRTGEEKPKRSVVPSIDEIMRMHAPTVVAVSHAGSKRVAGCAENAYHGDRTEYRRVFVLGYRDEYTPVTNTRTLSGSIIPQHYAEVQHWSIDSIANAAQRSHHYPRASATRFEPTSLYIRHGWLLSLDLAGESRELEPTLYG